MAGSVSNYKHVFYTIVRFFESVVQLVRKHVSLGLLSKRPVPVPPIKPGTQKGMEVSLTIAETQYSIRVGSDLSTMCSIGLRIHCMHFSAMYNRPTYPFVQCVLDLFLISGFVVTL